MPSYIAPSKPHPQSYRPDLPMPTVLQVRTDAYGAHATPSLTAWADSMVRLYAMRHRESKPVYSPTKAHPQSYRPDLPLKGSSGLHTLTAADRAYYKAHPITIRLSANAKDDPRYARLVSLNIHESEG